MRPTGVSRPKWRSNRDGSQAAIWRCLRAIGPSRPFTCIDVADLSHMPLASVQYYMRALVGC